MRKAAYFVLAGALGWCAGPGCNDGAECIEIAGVIGDTPGYNSCREVVQLTVCCNYGSTTELTSWLEITALEACGALLADGSFDSCDVEACGQAYPCTDTTGACLGLNAVLADRFCDDA